ncbi:MAG: hypothetical protein PHC66_03455 [Candidatus Nanoarchaeia archaeon]|nr:hypothetical protein [Candidatus Nanoarchaeia archaeon]MDD5239793.1 hypothetical protein [Candidatus Nanoarchaeia archaeon]
MQRRTKDAFLWIMSILHRHRIPYRISGGLAARIYGSKRRLADIDIDIPDKIHENRILSEVGDYIIFGPKRYVDHQFDLLLMTLKYKGQKIDICVGEHEKLFDHEKKEWVANKIDLSKHVDKKVYGLVARVIPKNDLIAYKRLMARKVDIADVKCLLKT